MNDDKISSQSESTKVKKIKDKKKKIKRVDQARASKKILDIVVKAT